MGLLMNAINYIAKTKPTKFLTGPYAPAAIGTVTILSGVSKDALNCVYYVTQSLNNKRIPEEKRNFVAGLDLANGILNVIIQTAAGFGYNKCVDKFFQKIIEPKYFPENFHKNFVTKYGLNPRVAENVANSLKTSAKAGLMAFGTLFVTQVICKRVIVPLIATPMATFFKNKFDANKKGRNKTNCQDTVQINNTKQSQALNHITHKNNKQENIPPCFKSFIK